MDKKQVQHVRKVVWKYYRTYGRHDLPWRNTTDPYHILVSEVMLQQTQVARVIPKYLAFIKQFPTVRKLARTDFRDVLVLWSGLGYNRRARFLQEMARRVMSEHGGVVPRSYDTLRTLPGVGPYTAGAVCVFSYNMPIPLLETNVRTVLFHHVLPGLRKTRDTELLELAHACMDVRNPREWHWALMDYGSYLKEQGVRTNMRSAHYAKQSTFKGSDREVRGAIIRSLTHYSHARVVDIVQHTKLPAQKVRTQLKKLEQEKMVRRRGADWYL